MMRQAEKRRLSSRANSISVNTLLDISVVPRRIDFDNATAPSREPMRTAGV
jgi:hypothetical protein